MNFGKLLTFSPLKKFLFRRFIAAVSDELRSLGTERIVFYDIGSRWGIWPEATRIPLPIYSVGVDADPTEAARLEKEGAFNRVIPIALSDTRGPRTLHLAREPGQSSLRRPDLNLIAQHCPTYNHEVVREILLQAMTLEEAISAYQLPPPDYIKIDVEGSDIDIIMTSLAILKAHCSGVFFEGRLAPFYEGEKLMGDGLQLLVANGFSVLYLKSGGSYWGAQMLFNCGLVPNPDAQGEKLSIDKLLKACLFALILENWEYARHLIKHSAAIHKFKNPTLKVLARRWTA